MKKSLMLLIVILLFLCTACTDSTPPSNISDNSGNSSNSIQSEAKASELVQAWLDDHPFDEKVTINDSLTSEDDSGFIFTLYQNGEFAQIRVVKNNGILLHRNPTKDEYISINDWYKNYKGKNASVEVTPTAEPTQSISIDDDEIEQFGEPESQPVNNQPKITLMYADNEFKPFNFDADVPDFFPFTSYEHRNLNENERYDLILEAESGLTYTYQNFDLTSDGIEQYYALLESLGFVKTVNDTGWRYYTKNDVCVYVDSNGESLNDIQYIEVGIFYNYTNEYEDYYTDNNSDAVDGDIARYSNDGFILYLPSNANIRSEVLKESVNQFSVSAGAEIPFEKSYEITLFYPINYIQFSIYENEDYIFNENNRITIPNADRAYLSKVVSDSILEESRYDLQVIRGDLVYDLTAKYDPGFALMGQAKGQDDFSGERESARKFKEAVEYMIANFALTDYAVDFQTICSTELKPIPIRDLVR